MSLLVSIFVFCCIQPLPPQALAEMSRAIAEEHKQVIDYYFTLSGRVAPELPNGGRIEPYLTYRFAFKGPDCGLFAVDRSAANLGDRLAVEELHCRNAKYFFMLSKSKSKPAYSLGNIWLNNLASQEDKDGMTHVLVSRTASIGFLAPCVLVDRTWAQWMSTKGFQVLSAAEVALGNRKLVRLDIRYRNENKNPGRLEPRNFDAVIFLGSDRHRLFESVEESFLGPSGELLARVKRSIDYDASLKYPVPRTITLYQPDPHPNGELKARAVYRVSDIKVVETDDQFRLSDYGFDEPTGVAWERPLPWFLWLFIVAFSCLVIGYLLKRFAWRETGA